MAEHALPEGLCMRRQPRQQRSQEVATRIEQATLALLREQGFAALNTNAIAARAGWHRWRSRRDRGTPR